MGFFSLNVFVFLSLTLLSYSCVVISAVCLCKRQNGRNATAEHVLDRGTVSENCCGYLVSVSANSYVHLCVCLLSEEKQSVCNFRSMCFELSLFYKQDILSFNGNEPV